MENKFILPIDEIQIRSSDNSKAKPYIKGKAKIVPGKKYSHTFKVDEKGNPIHSLKEIISENAWDKIKRKILSKQVFIDENHKTVAELNIDRYINDLQRETGKDLSSIKSNIKQWMKVSEMPLFKIEDANLTTDAIELGISMNPYYKDIDAEHSAFYDVMLNSIKDKYINSISLTFNPTDVTKKYDETINEFVPIINDMDVYGVSLLSSPAYDDMHDVLEVSIRSAQNVIEQGVNKMSNEDVNKIKNEVKKELNEDTLKAEIEKLKAENLEKETLLKQKEEAEKEAEKQKLIEEKERLQKELEERNRMLQAGSKGFVSHTMNNINDTYEITEQVKKILRPLEESRSLGKLIQLQVENKALETLPPETRRLLQKERHDIVIKREY